MCEMQTINKEDTVKAYEIEQLRVRGDIGYTASYYVVC